MHVWRDYAKMEGTATIPTQTAPVQLSGREIGVIQVIIPTVTCVRNNKISNIAVCAGDFCMNGGQCLYPDTNCTCTDGWTGERCTQSKTTPSLPPPPQCTVSRDRSFPHCHSDNNVCQCWIHSSLCGHTHPYSQNANGSISTRKEDSHYTRQLKTSS